MEAARDSSAVTCVGCRKVYVPEPAQQPGCPHCACLSWVAARLAESQRATPGSGAASAGAV
jgi:hypothetical protein